MRKILLLSAVILLFPGVLCFAMMGDDPDRSTVDLPEAAAKVLPDSGDVIASVKADLNGDGKDDYLVAFEYLNAERELLVVINQGKKYSIAARSKRAILCKECGGVYGDPFVRIWAEKKKFGVDHFGGSNFKWSNNSEFGYSRRDKNWQLVKFDDANYNLENDVEEKHYVPADFGLINLDMFDVNYYMSEGKIEPVPDETMVAISQEKTAVAEQKTAEVVANYTPTPVPPYVYKKPEQLKNTELISMKGGEFTQSDGTKSFKNILSPFKIGKNTVTYELWYVVREWAGRNGYKFNIEGRAFGDRFRDKILPDKDSLLPVIGISRRDVIVWCNAYSEMTKLKPVYCSDAAFKNPIRTSEFGDFPSSENKAKGSFDNPYVNWAADGYRLPTEGEWLYSASYIDGQKWADPAALKNEENKSGFVYIPNRLNEWLWDFYADYPASASDYAEATSDKKASAGKPAPVFIDYRGVEPADTPAGSPNVLHGGYTEKSAVDPNTFTVSLGYRIREYALVCSILNTFRVARKGN